MATFRVGVGSFNIKDGAVGFGTEIAGLGNLRVKGVTKTTGSIVSGASTLTRYSGFAADNINQLENITLTSEVGTIGDIVVGVGTSVIISSASTVTVGTVESVSIGTHFSPPVGGTEDRGQDFVEGMMRFNTDLNTLEFYNGNEWKQFTYISDIQNSPSSRGRCLRMGGSNGGTPHTNSIGFVNIHTLGNEISFGDLTQQTDGNGAVSSSIRAVNLGGYRMPANSLSDVMDYITIQSEGNAIDFGDMVQGARYMAAGTNGTRALIMGGAQPGYTTMITSFNISTLGNAVDTGGEYEGSESLPLKVYSPIRMIITSGKIGPATQNTMHHINIASTGDTSEFGESTLRGTGGACSNNVRGILQGYNGSTRVGMKHITIASLGELVEFGDLILNRSGQGEGNPCSHTRGVFMGGSIHPAYYNIIDYVNIQSLGNAIDFGDMSVPDAVSYGSATSDCHGGLGGY